MKVLVVSDTHRLNGNLEKVIEKTGPLDMLIHCGDVEGSEDYIEALAGCPAVMVAGNNDFFSALNNEEEISLLGHKIFVTHGHYYYVSLGTERLVMEAKDRGADIVLFGHTHRPVVEYHEGVTVANPGSISYPRQEGRKPSYLIMEIDRQGQVHFTVNYLNKDR